jgi:hypothetical protein
MKNHGQTPGDGDDIFSPPPDDSEVISQLERLNSNETKIAPRSVWIAVNGSDLSATTFMVSSAPKWTVAILTLMRNQSPPTTVMGSRKGRCADRFGASSGEG